MNFDDLMPFTAKSTVSTSVEEAEMALSVHAASSLLGLIHGPKFGTMDVFRTALLNLGWAMEVVPILSNGRVSTFKAIITGCKNTTDGWKYSVILESVNDIVQVRNADITKFGQNHDKNLAKAYSDMKKY